jgi:hypothetical protein
LIEIGEREKFTAGQFFSKSRFEAQKKRYAARKCQYQSNGNQQPSSVSHPFFHKRIVVDSHCGGKIGIPLPAHSSLDQVHGVFGLFQLTPVGFTIDLNRFDLFSLHQQALDALFQIRAGFATR